MQQHVHARAVDAGNAHLRLEGLDVEADLPEHLLEERVLLEAVAAAPPSDDLVLEVRKVEADAQAHLDVEVLEWHRRDVGVLQGPQRLEVGTRRALKANAVEVGLRGRSRFWSLIQRPRYVSRPSRSSVSFGCRMRAKFRLSATAGSLMKSTASALSGGFGRMPASVPASLPTTTGWWRMIRLRPMTSSAVLKHLVHRHHLRPAKLEDLAHRLRVRRGVGDNAADVIDEHGLHVLLAVAEQRHEGQEVAEADEAVEGTVAFAEDPGRPDDRPLQAALLQVVLRHPLEAEPVLFRARRRAGAADVDEALHARGLRGVDLIAGALVVDLLEGPALARHLDG